MAKTKTKIKKVNITPTSNNMVVTAYIQKVDSDLILSEHPKFMNVQQVLAIGPNVADVKVGDWVYIDYERFVKHVKTKSEIKVGVGGQDMIKTEFIPPAFAAPGDDEAYFKITDREIEGVIIDYDALPKDMKEYILVSTYENKREKAELEAAKLKEEMDKKMREAAKFNTTSEGPAIYAEGKHRG